MQISHIQGSRSLMCHASHARALTSHHEPEHTLERGSILEVDAAPEWGIQESQAPRFTAEVS